MLRAINALQCADMELHEALLEDPDPDSPDWQADRFTEEIEDLQKAVKHMNDAEQLARPNRRIRHR